MRKAINQRRKEDEKRKKRPGKMLVTSSGNKTSNTFCTTLSTTFIHALELSETERNRTITLK